MKTEENGPERELGAEEELRSSNSPNNTAPDSEVKGENGRVETVAERGEARSRETAAAFARFERLFSGSDLGRGGYDPTRTEIRDGKVEIKDTAKTIKGAATTYHFAQHLLGTTALGVIPIRNDSTVSFAAIDIDVYDLDVVELLKVLKQEKVPLVVCRSKSGGAHLYAFFSEPVAAANARELLKGWAARIGHLNAEVFPKQSELKAGELGNWINLPYFDHEQVDRYAPRENGMALSLGEFCDLAENVTISTEDLRRHLDGMRAKADAPRSEKPKPAPGAVLTIEEARERLEELAVGVQEVERHGANEKLWRAIRDAAPLVRDCGLTEGEVRDRLERAWKERKAHSTDHPGAIQLEFDRTFASHYRHGFEHRDAPRRKRDLLVVRKLSNIPAQPIEWLWPGRIAIGKVSLIAGQPGLGKSQLTTYIGAQVTIGGPWPFDEGAAPLGDVILLSAEDDAGDTIRPRFEVAHADLDRVQVVDLITRREGGQRGFNLEKDVAMLDELLSATPKARLVIIDPISTYLGNIDSNRNSDVRGLLAPVQKLAEQRRVAVVAVSHLTKALQSAINSVNGSGAFVAASRATYIVARETDEKLQGGEMVKEETGRRIVALAKNNLAPDGADRSMIYHIEQRQTVDGLFAPIIVWDQKVSITADEVLAASAPSPGGRAPKLEAAKAFLREYLASGLMQQKHVESAARDQGIKPDTLNNAKKALGIVVDKLGGLGGPWVWSLPGSQPELEVDEPAQGAF